MTYSDQSFDSLRREAEQSRRSIENRISSISNGISSEVSSIKGKIQDTVDWRTQARTHPLAVGAVALIAGYAAARLLKNGISMARSTNSRDNGHSIGFSPASSSESFRPQAKRENTRPSVISNLGESLMNEIEKVGREVVIPTIIGLVTSKVSGLVDLQKTSRPQASANQAQAYPPTHSN